jgi:hypothetical protein
VGDGQASHHGTGVQKAPCVRHSKGEGRREEGGGREQQRMIRYSVRSRCDANTGISGDFDTLSAARGLDIGNGWMMLFALCS